MNKIREEGSNPSSLIKGEYRWLFVKPPMY